MCHTFRMPDKKPPKDFNELAKYIVDVATGDTEPVKPREKNAAAVELSKLGASKGGQARALKLSDKKKKQIAKKGATARWAKYHKEQAE